MASLKLIVFSPQQHALCLQSLQCPVNRMNIKRHAAASLNKWQDASLLQFGDMPDAYANMDCDALLVAPTGLRAVW